MTPARSLFWFVVRDVLFVLCATVAVCSTLLISSVETLIALMDASKNTEAPGTTEFSGMTSLLIFYYVTLGFFVCVCVFVLFNFVVRANLELQILSGRRRLKELLSSSWCFAYSLHYSLYTAIILLIGLFCAYWAFWGSLLNSLFWRMQLVLERLSASDSGGPLPAESVRSLQEAANRTFGVVVCFVLSVSLNVLVLLRLLFNKVTLLRLSRVASAFRILLVDLTELGSSGKSPLKYLIMSFVFDVIELWTLSAWCLYPIFVAVFWVLERKCVGSDPFMLSLSSDSLSPLIGCMFAARYHLLVVVVAWLAVVSGCTLTYLLRLLDERRIVQGKTSSARWWHLGPFLLVMCVLFWAALAATILSFVMMGKPLLSSTVDVEQRIYLAAPGVVLMCGNVLLLFHVIKKFVVALQYREKPTISFFFERGVPLPGGLDTDTPSAPSIGATGVRDYELESQTPYRALEEDILY